RWDFTYFDTNGVHIDDQCAQASMSFSRWIASGQQKPTLSHIGVTCPDLFAVHNEIVSVENGRGPQRCQVGTGIWLAEELRPLYATLGNLGQQRCLLFVGTVADDDRSDP